MVPANDHNIWSESYWRIIPQLYCLHIYLMDYVLCYIYIIWRTMIHGIFVIFKGICHHGMFIIYNHLPWVYLGIIGNCAQNSMWNSKCSCYRQMGELWTLFEFACLQHLTRNMVVEMDGNISWVLFCSTIFSKLKLNGIKFGKISRNKANLRDLKAASGL